MSTSKNILLTVFITLLLSLGVSFFNTDGSQSSQQTEVGKSNSSLSSSGYEKKAATPHSPSVGEIVAVFSSFQSNLSSQIKETVATTLLEVSRQNNLDPWLILAIIQVESTFSHRARSSVGALGLMQIRPFVGKAVALELGMRWNSKEILYDPSKNILIGVHFFHKLYQRFGDLDTALTAYNYGPTYVRKVLNKGGTLPENYSRKVRKAYRTNLSQEKSS